MAEPMSVQVEVWPVAADEVGLWLISGEDALNYIDWFNHRRLFETCGDIPPAELEQARYRHNTGLAEAG